MNKNESRGEALRQIDKRDKGQSCKQLYSLKHVFGSLVSSLYYRLLRDIRGRYKAQRSECTFLGIINSYLFKATTCTRRTVAESQNLILVQKVTESRNQNIFVRKNKGITFFVQRDRIPFSKAIRFLFCVPFKSS